MNTRITHYKSEAYNLPTGVIYYVGPPLSTYCHAIISSDTRYPVIPLELSENNLEEFLKLRPDFSREEKRQLIDMISPRGDQPFCSCRTTLTSRIEPDKEGFTFFEADITDCPEDLLAEAIERYAGQLYMLEQTGTFMPEKEYSYLPEEDGMPEMKQCSAPKKSSSPHGLLRRITGIMPSLRKEEVCGSGASDLCMSPAQEEDYICESYPESDKSAAETTNDLLEELQRRLAAIPQTDGINILLQRQFEDFFRTLDTLAPRPLSELHIDESLHILLPGYDIEIQMLPVWKAVYILFLRHEEGIILNQMPDYRDEFACIYKSFAAGEPANIENTINEVTTPGSDIFRQYKSKINAAFRQVLAEDLAQHYIISGSRNAPYKIQLPRDKVFIRCASGTAHQPQGAGN